MDQRLPLDARAISTMGLLSVVWGLQQVSLKMAAAEVGPMLMVAVRSGIASVLVLLVLALAGQWRTLTLSRWRPGLLAGALFAIEYLLLALALEYTHASHVVVYLYTAPLFVALGLHTRFPSERLGLLQWLGIGAAFAGILWAFMGQAPQSDAALPLMWWGDLLALLAGIAWAGTTITIRCSSLSSAPPVEILLYLLVVTCVMLLPASQGFGQAHFVLSFESWWHLVFQCVLVSCVSFWVWFGLLRRYLASRLGVFSFLTPLLGVLMGMWLLGEAISAGFMVGGGLVLLGIVLVNLQAFMPRVATTGKP